MSYKLFNFQNHFYLIKKSRQMFSHPTLISPLLTFLTYGTISMDVRAIIILNIFGKENQRSWFEALNS